ncbi:hypothetical protein R5A26_18705 [Streptomyces prunicolor]|uniref:Uncharacterized protein n=1 Tax=Streptomyces prunicolor TaxID=67348 RepID=A0ABU4FBL2_9ACTN|nr:hypothetical protein [Streptomyces prunicolor]MDV7217982.1 hypothetical protein [Streptomyces prunicolor]
MVSPVSRFRTVANWAWYWADPAPAEAASALRNPASAASVRRRCASRAAELPCEANRLTVSCRSFWNSPTAGCRAYVVFAA